MKGRLSSTLTMLAIGNALALIVLMGFAYSAGRTSGGLAIWDAFSAQGDTPMKMLIALLVLVLAAAAVFWITGARVAKPVKELADFSERLANGDYRAKAEVDSTDDFGFIAENLNRTADKVSRTVFNQEAQDSLQKSVTEFLTITSQIARGDLTLRGKVTNDALGNVVDSVNYMLDNFAKVLERVRKAAIDVSASANEILVSADEMSHGANQQDQEITNTSSAVEELTVLMKQVSI